MLSKIMDFLKGLMLKVAPIMALLPSTSSSLLVSIGIFIGYLLHPILKPFIIIAFDLIKLLLKL
jgi:hypothetical protein